MTQPTVHITTMKGKDVSTQSFSITGEYIAPRIPAQIREWLTVHREYSPPLACFLSGGGKHNPKTVSLVKATQHLKKQFSMETINAALISIPTAYLFGGILVALVLYKAVPKG